MSISTNHNFVVANDTLSTLTKIRNGIEKQTFDGDNLNTKISNFPVGGATETTLNSIKTQLEKQTFDGDNLNTKISNFPTGGATETTLNSIKTQLEKQTFDGDNLNTKISNFPTTLATETTLDGIKTQLEKQTFDGDNSLNVTIVSDLTQGGGGGSIDISTLATEDTLSSYTQFIIDNDLRFLRSEGRVFSATIFLNVINNKHQYVLFNPANSNKTLFCIETALSIKRSGNNYTLICNLQRIKGFSGGSGQTPVSMNFTNVGENTTSVAQVFRNVNDVSNATDFYKFQIDDTGTSNFVKEWKEYIEIAPGYGITMFISNVEQGETICPVFRWFEE